jgi:diphthamide synthase (EF-2-diphthine--ammonia ligase)
VRTPVVVSWSAGKDSAFGLWTLIRDPAYEVRALLTTLTEGYDRVSMSGVREELLDRQANVVGLPVIKVMIPPACTNEVYEQRMASTLAVEVFRGIDHVAFSDLFLEDVRAYREERLGWAGKNGVFPLWGRDTAKLAREMVEAGFRAIVVCVDPSPSPPPSPAELSTWSSWLTFLKEWTLAGRTVSSTRSSGTHPCTGRPSGAASARW